MTSEPDFATTKEALDETSLKCCQKTLEREVDPQLENKSQDLGSRLWLVALAARGQFDKVVSMTRQCPPPPKKKSWLARLVYFQETFMACRLSSTVDPNSSMAQVEVTPGASHISHSSSLPSRFTLSSLSPSLSPFRSINISSKVNSPGAGHSRVNSPSFSKLAALR